MLNIDKLRYNLEKMVLDYIKPLKRFEKNGYISFHKNNIRVLEFSYKFDVLWNLDPFSPIYYGLSRNDIKNIMKKHKII